MTSKSADDWREKYLDVLDEQERLQKTFEQQHELLRRALVRVSLAAEGHDETLDRHLSVLRGVVKSESGDLEAAMEAVESSLLQYEGRKEARESVTEDALKTMAEALQAQTEDRSLRKNLKGFVRALLKGEAGTLTDQLKQLQWLQQQVFEAKSDSEAAPAGFMARLLGKAQPQNAEVGAEAEELVVAESAPHQADTSDDNSSTSLNDSKETTPEFIAAEAGNDRDLGDSQQPELESEPESVSSVLEGELQTKAEAQEQDDKHAQFQRPVNEPAFSRVSDKVKRVLSDLLDKVEPADCTEQKAHDARERIERGLNWYELVPTLEDIRDLVLQAYLLADEEYREYLRQIHQVLETILTGLGITVTTQQEWLLADQNFDQTLTQQLGSLGRSVAIATEVSALKQDVTDHLQAIQQALTDKQNNTAKSKLGEQLAELVAQVKQVEQEAASAKAELEEQKQKALTDSLTGLANREAYNDRGFHEWNRWKRYGHPLTLVVCDIDHFKKINDNYGHQAGDRVLQVLSKAVSQRLREVDFMARYGGEEFVILLPETEQSGGFEVMDKIRSVIASTPFRFKQVPVQVTLSMGIVGLKEGDSLESAFARADALLYQAKEAGRNCCMQDDRAAH
jgi:diguanylate cyclase